MILNACSVTYQVYESFRVSCLPSFVLQFPFLEYGDKNFYRLQYELGFDGDNLSNQNQRILKGGKIQWDKSQWTKLITIYVINLWCIIDTW